MKDPTKLRAGLMMAKDTAYNIAWHIKSFYFGKWSDKFFPLLFCPEIIITYNT